MKCSRALLVRIYISRSRYVTNGTNTSYHLTNETFLCRTWSLIIPSITYPMNWLHLMTHVAHGNGSIVWGMLHCTAIHQRIINHWQSFKFKSVHKFFFKMKLLLCARHLFYYYELFLNSILFSIRLKPKQNIFHPVRNFQLN